jgi:hypothetical protein
MSDIVERLQHEYERRGIECVREAADEIKRLNKTLDDHLESEAMETRRADCERDRARKAEAEIERLRETARVYTEQFLDQEREATAQAKEIKQLRENVEEAARLNLAVMKKSEHFFRETERLRTLLREWLDSPCQPIATDILRRTREALGNEKPR